MNIDARQQDIVRVFAGLTDGIAKYRYLVNLAAQSAPMPEKYKVEANLVPGCTAQAWIRCYIEDEKAYYQADSPSAIVRGLAALLIRVLSGATPDAICAADLYFIERIGLRNQISPTRSNGLFGMLKRMRSFAAEHASGLSHQLAADKRHQPGA